MYEEKYKFILKICFWLKSFQYIKLLKINFNIMVGLWENSINLILNFKERYRKWFIELNLFQYT